jgi:molybdopterin converting factor small subunit
MAVTIILPDALRPFAGLNERVWVEARTAGEAIETLLTTYPDLRAQLPSDLEQPPHGAAIFRNGHDLRRLQGLATPLDRSDRLTIVVPAGGQ